MGDVLNMHGMLQIEHMWQMLHYFVINYLLFFSVSLLLSDMFMTSSCFYNTQENASENGKDIKIMIKITKSEIKTELELQSLQKSKLK